MEWRIWTSEPHNSIDRNSSMCKTWPLASKQASKWMPRCLEAISESNSNRCTAQRALPCFGGRHTQQTPSRHCLQPWSMLLPSHWLTSTTQRSPSRYSPPAPPAAHCWGCRGRHRCDAVAPKSQIPFALGEKKWWCQQVVGLPFLPSVESGGRVGLHHQCL
jgi:hypothetical protein